MAQKRKLDTVKITLDKPRTLKLDFNALIELEELTGKPVHEIFDGRNWDFKLVRDIVYVLLIHEDDTLTPKQVSSMIDLYKMDELMSAVRSLIFDTNNPKNE